MQTIGQDRLRNLEINYRRSRIRLMIISAVTIVLIIHASYMLLKIHSIKVDVRNENAHYISEAEADKEASETARNEKQAELDEAKARNGAIMAEIEALRDGN